MKEKDTYSPTGNFGIKALLFLLLLLLLFYVAEYSIISLKKCTLSQILLEYTYTSIGYEGNDVCCV